MREKLNNIPIWFINLISVASGIISILSFIYGIVTVILSIKYGVPFNDVLCMICLILFLFCVMAGIRILKYRKMSNGRMEAVSSKYYLALSTAKELYFQIMNQHKNGVLTTKEVLNAMESDLSKLLDALCSVMGHFTNREISACIKVIADCRDQEEITIHSNISLVTLYRSSNSNIDRGRYESQTEKIKLCDNTDFLDVINPDNPKGYFYCGNLEAYDKELHKVGKKYKNTNENWSNYYIGTIVVPIQIKNKLAYHTIRNDNSFNLIGFLCIDSLSKDAFTKKQEKYNVNVVRSFAEIMYFLLGQYRHYLRKLGTTIIDQP